MGDGDRELGRIERMGRRAAWWGGVILGLGLVGVCFLLITSCIGRPACERRGDCPIGLSIPANDPARGQK